jgi:hypothetical protein
VVMETEQGLSNPAEGVPWPLIPGTEIEPQRHKVTKART